MFAKAVARINHWMASLAVVLIVFMMFSMTIDIFMRYLFNAPIAGVVELDRTLLVIVVFFSVGYCQLRKKHILAEFLLDRLSEKPKTLVIALETILALVIMVIFTYGCVTNAIESTMDLEHEVGIVNFPIWPSKIAIAFGLIMLDLQYVFDIIDGFRAYFRK